MRIAPPSDFLGAWIGPYLEKEVLKTIVRMILIGRKGIYGNGNQPNYLSTMERGKVEIGAEILLRISREFVKSVEWLLTGER